MYKDFEDLRDNCPVEIKADIAVDFRHKDGEKLAAFWPSTSDGEFRLYLTQRVSDFWERKVRERGGDSVPEDCLAMHIMVDSYQDPDMGHSLFLELHAFCGTEKVGELVWDAFDDPHLEDEFMKTLPGQILDLVARMAPLRGIQCDIEIAEVAEL
ncbi:MAG: hypothetical protein GY780_06620 [bacterium]|nr:hypothetical protein [bacterium]